VVKHHCLSKKGFYVGISAWPNVVVLIPPVSRLFGNSSFVELQREIINLQRYNNCIIADDVCGPLQCYVVFFLLDNSKSFSAKAAKPKSGLYTRESTTPLV
jgi:hypothetical protein